MQISSHRLIAVPYPCNIQYTTQDDIPPFINKQLTGSRESPFEIHQTCGLWHFASNLIEIICEKRNIRRGQTHRTKYNTTQRMVENEYGWRTQIIHSPTTDGRSNFGFWTRYAGLQTPSNIPLVLVKF